MSLFIKYCHHNVTADSICHHSSYFSIYHSISVYYIFVCVTAYHIQSSQCQCLLSCATTVSLFPVIWQQIVTVYCTLSIPVIISNSFSWSMPPHLNHVFILSFNTDIDDVLDLLPHLLHPSHNDGKGCSYFLHLCINHLHLLHHSLPCCCINHSNSLHLCITHSCYVYCSLQCAASIACINTKIPEILNNTKILNSIDRCDVCSKLSSLSPAVSS